MSLWLFNVFMDKCGRNVHDDVISVLLRNMNVYALFIRDDAILLAEVLYDAIRNINLKTYVSKPRYFIFDKEKAMNYSMLYSVHIW